MRQNDRRRNDARHPRGNTTSSSKARRTASKCGATLWIMGPPWIPWRKFVGVLIMQFLCLVSCDPMASGKKTNATIPVWDGCVGAQVTGPGTPSAFCTHRNCQLTLGRITVCGSVNDPKGTSTRGLVCLPLCYHTEHKISSKHDKRYRLDKRKSWKQQMQPRRVQRVDPVKGLARRRVGLT